MILCYTQRKSAPAGLHCQLTPILSMDTPVMPPKDGEKEGMGAPMPQPQPAPAEGNDQGEAPAEGQPTE